MIKEILKQDESTKLLINNKEINKKFKNVNIGYLSHAIALDFEKAVDSIFVVCANLYEAQMFYDNLSHIVNREDLLFYPTDQILTQMMALGSPEFKSERLFTIKQLLKENKKIVVTTIFATQLITLSKDDYINASKTYNIYDSIKIEDLSKDLVYSGYQKTYTVEHPGTFSVRGSIVDIFPLGSKYPYRLDFFDIQIESIKLFDVLTQRSFEEVSSISIMPINELFYKDDMIESFVNNIKSKLANNKLNDKELEKLNQDIEYIENRIKLDSLNYYIQFLNITKSTILDFVNNKKIYLIDIEKMYINDKSMYEDLDTFKQTVLGSTYVKNEMFISIDNIIKKAHNIIDNKGFYYNDSINLNVKDVNKYQANLEAFYFDYKNEVNNKLIYIHLDSNILKEEVINFFKDKDIDILKDKNQGFKITNSYLVGSFELDNYVFIESSTLFNKKIRKAMEYRSVLNSTTKIRDVDELEVLDYVVHYDYGIGRFMGLKTMELSGYKKDYLHIVYLNDESLYVPMEQIELVLKYQTGEGISPKLSKMGGKIWNKTKSDARRKIKDLSDRLIKLYAKRGEVEGFKFSKDDEMQEKFERDFIYEETVDQMRAIIDTKFDMQSSRPMDRLICGDVGFGKTEVALRAAFKAVLNQKQVMYLVPTTVLARQHYYTFKERFDKYGANVVLLNRFTKLKEQREILEKLEKGYIDVIIGTHRLLSKDIKYKDLGLLIVDEEQRFGVEHKERIKEIKHNVDALTLTATPIPRTLQMSLLGLKDLSMIETPPLNRYPVQTYVVKKDKALIKEAINRELARGGQVFYLLNKIHLMENKLLELQNLIPDAKITYIHGKMKRDDIEKSISDFANHEYDILLATTIIETGIDMPNTNTLIIEHSDTLGLSQLYQLRGRVGRSDKIAYAYLLYDEHKHINEDAKKRLQAIEDFTSLGSGYKIALRDLSIRGAGDILGSEQSGFIDSVGAELYQKLLKEALTGTNELDLVNKEQSQETYAPRHIEPEYISDEKVRIEIHKRIGSIKSINDLEDLRLELEDRFGKVSPDLMLYMYEKLFKIYSHYYYIDKTTVKKDIIELTFKESANDTLNGMGLFKVANTYHLKTSLKNNRGKVMLEINIKGEKAHWLYLIIKYIDDNKKLMFKL